MTALSPLARLNKGAAIYAFGATMAVIVGFILSHLPHGLDHWSADLQTAYLSPRLPTQHPRIALVIINGTTLEQYPYVSPVDRQLLADLIDRIDQSGPKAIGIDFIFDRPTEEVKDNSLLHSIQQANAQIVLGSVDTRTSLSERDRAFQTNFLTKAKRPIGHFYFDEKHEVLVISDHVVRFIAKPSPEQPTQKSFAEVLAATDGQVEPQASKYIAWLLPPENGAETFLTLSAEQVLGRTNPPIALPLTDLFANRIVVIGGNFPDRDYHLTPLSVVTKQRFHGIFIHAQILAQLLDHRSIRPLSWPIVLVLLAFAACAGIWVGRRDRSRHYHVWIESAGAIGLVAVNALMFAILGTIFPIMLTLLFLLVGAAIGYHSRRLLT